MLHGHFAVGTGRPHIGGELWIPRFNLRSGIRFCIDTGAVRTVLMPYDAFRMSIDYSELDDETNLATVGGATSAFLEPVELIFTDSVARIAYVYRVMLAIAAPSPDVIALPSLLGCDAITRWRIDYHPTAGQLLCNVVTADEVIELPSS